MLQKVEVLAPAGSFEIMKAVIKAGADAVYIGGSRFGARAFADNPGEDEMLEAIDYAHLHGRKLYMTVNTLLKNRELEGELCDYLMPYYERGLDAVIVQDPGVFDLIRRNFPSLAIHASTQMTVCGTSYGRFLAEKGAARIVTPRELSIKEIAALKEASGVEIETFVHGALCYCYSGQCLMSSMIGGRSGNRGRCAQPCRLNYKFTKDGKTTQGCLLSPKDLCSLDVLPEMIEAGIDSLKIEGRMKKPEYAAFTTAVYRKYVDLYLKEGRKGYRVEESDREALMDIYNRGGFTGGYFHQHNGADMITKDRPNHTGLQVGTMTVLRKKEPAVKTVRDLEKGDILELPGGVTVKVPGHTAAGQLFKVKAEKNLKLSGPVMRTRNEKLIGEVTEKYVRNPEIKEKIKGIFTVSKEFPVILEVTDGRHTVRVTGDPAEPALNQPATEEELIKRLSKTGQTPFRFESIDVRLESECYMPVQKINEIRREALEELKDRILADYERKAPERVLPEVREKENTAETLTCRVLVRTEAQLKAALKFDEVTRIYVPYEGDPAHFIRMAQMAHNAGKAFYAAGPHVLREDCRDKWQRIFKEVPSDLIDGFLIRNMETGLLLKESGDKRPVITDYSMYCMNDRASGIFGNAYDEITMPLELNKKEMFNLSESAGREMILYGYTPVMVSAQCLTRTCGKCTKKPQIDMLTDRLGKHFRVQNICYYCYNVIYNTVPLFLPEALDDRREKQFFDHVRLQFLDESGEVTEKVIGRVMRGNRYEPAEFTKGHYKRGVE